MRYDAWRTCNCAAHYCTVRTVLSTFAKLQRHARDELKLPAGRPSSRQRILEAAEALAREQGPGNISLDAVAARAGLSKGGLLYNFPTKAKLLEALVEMHIERAEAALAQSVEAGRKAAMPWRLPICVTRARR